jgi:hypothetical protein
MKTFALLMAMVTLPALAQGKKFEAVCGADAQKVCPGLAPHQGLHKCMHEHEAQLSPTCSQFLAEVRAKHKGGPGQAPLSPPPPAPAPAQ